MWDAKKERGTGDLHQDKACWLTSTVCQAVEDVAFMTEALETPGRVDTEVVTGAVKRALINICIDQKTWY